MSTSPTARRTTRRNRPASPAGRRRPVRPSSRLIGVVRVFTDVSADRDPRQARHSRDGRPLVPAEWGHDRSLGTYHPYEPDDRRPVPAQAPITVSGQGQWTGTATATAVQTRVEGGGPNAPGETVLSFRLRGAGRDQPVEVELRAHRLTGTVAEGDQVVVPATIGRSGRLEPQRLQNLTTRVRRPHRQPAPRPRRARDG